jgi:hypothetical protein
MEEHPHVGVLGGAVRFMDLTGKVLRTEHNPVKDSLIRSALLKGDCPFWHPTTVIRKDVFLAVGGYRGIVPHAEDHDLWLRLADLCELANLPEVVLKYRLHPQQVTVRKYREMAISNLAARGSATSRRAGKPDPLDSVTEITPEVLSHFEIRCSQVEAMIASRILWSIRTMYSIGEYGTAMRSFEEVMRTSDWKHADKRLISDIYLFGAKLYWRKGRFARSLSNATRAIITRPQSLGRPIKRLFTRRSRFI